MLAGLFVWAERTAATIPREDQRRERCNSDPAPPSLRRQKQGLETSRFYLVAG
jgi:hypothetical protein